MNAKSLRTLASNSELIATSGNSAAAEDSTSLYAAWSSLYQHKNGKWYIRDYGGAAIDADNDPRWVTRDEAVDFIASRVTDGVTGYGFSGEQAEIMVDGGDAGRGYRGRQNP